jgi:hypothetical protein
MGWSVGKPILVTALFVHGAAKGQQPVSLKPLLQSSIIAAAAAAAECSVGSDLVPDVLSLRVGYLRTSGAFSSCRAGPEQYVFKSDDGDAKVEAPVVQVVCDGAASSSPLTKATATCSATAPPGVKWLRFDRIDQCTSYGCMRSSPFYHNTAWGMTAIELPIFGVDDDNPAAGPAGSHPVGTIRLAASGWSSRWNATLLGNSSAIKISYDWHAFRDQKLSVEAKQLRLATVELRGVALNASLPAPEHWTFCAFRAHSGNIFKSC